MSTRTRRKSVPGKVISEALITMRIDVPERHHETRSSGGVISPVEAQGETASPGSGSRFRSAGQGHDLDKPGHDLFFQNFYQTGIGSPSGQQKSCSSF